MSEETHRTKSLHHFMKQMAKECPQPECEAHLGRRRSEGLRLVSSPLSQYNICYYICYILSILEILVTKEVPSLSR